MNNTASAELNLFTLVERRFIHLKPPTFKYPLLFMGDHAKSCLLQTSLGLEDIGTIVCSITHIVFHFIRLQDTCVV